MDLPELPERPGYVAHSSLATEDWQQAIHSLRLLFIGTLATLLILSASLNLFLYKQAKLARQELDKTAPVVSQMTTEYAEKSVPLINEFLARLNAFARTNPDFSPILSRHSSTTAGFSQPIAPSTGTTAR